jgi:hypothetical protein
LTKQKQLFIYLYDNKLDSKIICLKFLYQIKNDNSHFENQWDEMPITQFDGLFDFYENGEKANINITDISNKKLSSFLMEQGLKKMYYYNLCQKNKPFALFILLDPNKDVDKIFDDHKEKITQAVLEIL